MEENIVVFKSSFKGIISQIIKLAIYLVLSLISYFIFHLILRAIYNAHHLNSISDLIVKIFDIKLNIAFQVLIINLILLLLGILIIVLLCNGLLLFYHVKNVTVFDFQIKKIVNTEFKFPMIKYSDEIMFDSIIEIQVKQDYFDILFNTGNIYMEYYSSSKDEINIRSIYIKHIYEPFNKEYKLNM